MAPLLESRCRAYSLPGRVKASSAAYLQFPACGLGITLFISQALDSSHAAGKQRSQVHETEGSNTCYGTRLPACFMALPKQPPKGKQPFSGGASKGSPRRLLTAAVLPCSFRCGLGPGLIPLVLSPNMPRALIDCCLSPTISRSRILVNSAFKMSPSQSQICPSFIFFPDVWWCCSVIGSDRSIALFDSPSRHLILVESSPSKPSCLAPALNSDRAVQSQMVASSSWCELLLQLENWQQSRLDNGSALIPARFN